MMSNDIALTDDELSLIVTSLLLTIESHKKYISIHGEYSLDFTTKEAVKGIVVLHDRLIKEYF